MDVPTGCAIQRGATMMNLQAVPGTAPRMYSPIRVAERLERGEGDWSSLQEVMDLLLFDGHASQAVNGQLFRRRRIKAGQSVFLMGQPFEGLYVVRLGALKTIVIDDDGSEHVLSFSMKGDLMGTDGICKDQYCTEAVALTDCEVIRLPATELFLPGRGCNELERMAYWAISREVVKEQMSYTLSHASKSEVRVARFLLMQSNCFSALGYSPRRFTLPMTRRDIGSYLSVTLETVSRALSALHNLGIIEVASREITILSREALHAYEG